MDKKETTQRPVNSSEIDGAARQAPNPQDDTHPHLDRLLEEIVSALKTKNTVRDTVARHNDEYEVETIMQASDREWYFIATVRHNGNEITDDIELAPDELRRKRVTQANKSKALWNLFVKEAAQTHLEKCRCVKRRLATSTQQQWHTKRYVLPVVAALIAALAGIGIYMGYVTTPPTIPTAQTPPAVQRTTEKATTTMDARPVAAAQDGLTPKPVTPSPAPLETQETRGDSVRAENQPTEAPHKPPAAQVQVSLSTPEPNAQPSGQARNEAEPASEAEQPLPSATQSNDIPDPGEKKSTAETRLEPPAAQAQGGLSTPEPNAQPSGQAQNEPEPASETQQPLPSATQSNDIPDPGEKKSTAETRLKQPAAQAQEGLATPEPDGQPRAANEESEKYLMNGRETPEPLQQQTVPQLSPEEIKQKVKKLLNNQN